MKFDASVFRRSGSTMSVTARRLADFEIAIAGMEQTLRALAEFVDAEERRANITDVNHCTYPMVAKAAIERSNRLKRSIVNLKVERDRALSEHNRTQVSFVARQVLT
jgi:flagellar FliJ protein